MKNILPKNVLLSFLFVIICSSLFAQGLNIDWQKQIYDAGRNKKIALDADSNCYVAFSHLDTGTVYQCPADSMRWIYITKLDKNGNCLWSKSYLDMDADNTVKGLVVDKYNDVYLFFACNGGKLRILTDSIYINKPAVGYAAFILKIDKNGHEKWVHKIGGSNQYATKPCNLLINDTSVFLIDHTSSGQTFFYIDTTKYTSSFTSQIFIARFSFSGNVEQIAFIAHGSSYNNQFVPVMNNGKFGLLALGAYVTPVTPNHPLVFNTDTNQMPYTVSALPTINYVEFDDSLRVTKVKYVKGKYRALAPISVVKGSDGYLYASVSISFSRVNNPYIQLKNNVFLPPSSCGLALIRFNDSLEADQILFFNDTILANPLSNNFINTVMVERPDNGLIFATDFSDSIKVNGASYYSTGNKEDILLCSIDSSLNIEWAYQLGSDSGDNVKAIKKGIDGSFYLLKSDGLPSNYVYYNNVPFRRNSLIKFNGSQCFNFNNRITVGRNTLVSSNVITGTQYVWVDCDADTIVATTSANTFNPAYEGSYKLILINGVCRDTTACIDYVGCTLNKAVGSTSSGLYAVENSNNVYYAWINCDNGEMEDGNSQIFYPDSTGNYAVILYSQSLNGCIDTSDCINYIACSLNNSVGSTDSTLYAIEAANNASYVWINCGSGRIEQSSGQIFYPDSTGDYAVILHSQSLNGCTDTSACISYNACKINNAIGSTDSTLYAVETGNGASYIWINCSSSKIEQGNGQVFYPDSTGDYAVVVYYQSLSGCRDTSACINYTACALNNIVGSTDSTLYAIETSSNANYVWINCSSGEVEGNSQIFYPDSTGDYAVILYSQSVNGCVDTSACIRFNLVITGISAIVRKPEFFKVSPNPTNHTLNVSISSNFVGAQLNIYNLEGMLIKTAQLQATAYKLETENYSSGVYIAEVKVNGTTQRIKWVKI
jgi:hypothetical protein